MHGELHFIFDLVSSAGMDGNISSRKKHENPDKVAYAIFQRQLRNRITGTEPCSSVVVGRDRGRRIPVLHVICVAMLSSL